MKRREFLERTGWFVVGATLVGIPGCGDDTRSKPPGTDGGTSPNPAGTFSFPQGVASGDPRETSVVLWTRVVRGTSTDPVAVVVEVATSADFSDVVVNQSVSATATSDHTVRVLVTGLTAGTPYFYRFTAGQDAITGRTTTAPEAKADVQVNFAWVSCQDYAAGNYGAYRQMLIDDDARAEADKILAVIHLGDMIYETRSSTFQTAINDSFDAVGLTNADGSVRAVPAFPSGGGERGTDAFAVTVEDYRSLYKTFLSDPDLQAARARWPFIAIWDDHEFTNDCWQSQANYTNGATIDEPDQLRRVAASQAWFEYVPAQLTGADGVPGVIGHARDFIPPATPVTDAAFTDANPDTNFVDEPNNVAAVGAITIYRSLRFGQHVELVLTDERSYRSDHALPEQLAGVLPGIFDPRNALPKIIVNQLDKGMADGQAKIIGTPIDNPRQLAPTGTMLGKAQKKWWMDTMQKSDATWKLWGNEVTLMRLRLTALGQNSQVPLDLVVSADAWDGYNSERTELMTFLKDNTIKNVIVLTGDIHAAFAGRVMEDFEVTDSPAVAVEFVGPGISSNSLLSFFQAATKNIPVPQGAPAGTPRLVDLIATETAPDSHQFLDTLNLLLIQGTAAAGTFAATRSLAAAQTMAVDANPHVKYVDTNSQGYAYIQAGADQVNASIITIQRPIQMPSATAGPGIKRTAQFTVKKVAGAEEPVLVGPMFNGGDTKPFPLT